MAWPVRDYGLVNLLRCTKIDAYDDACKSLKPLLVIPCVCALNGKFSKVLWIKESPESASPLCAGVMTVSFSKSQGDVGWPICWSKWDCKSLNCSRYTVLRGRITKKRNSPYLIKEFRFSGCEGIIQALITCDNFQIMTCTSDKISIISYNFPIT